MGIEPGSASAYVQAGSARRASLDVVVLYNDTGSVRRGDATDDLPDGQVEGVERVLDELRTLGHRAHAVAVAFDTLSDITELRADFALNLCEGTGLDGHPGIEVVAALGRRGIPYSGTSEWPYHVSSDKWRMKRALTAAGVPVPYGVTTPSVAVGVPSTLRFPVFVKPSEGYGSVGIDEDSLVHSPHDVPRAVGRLVAAGDAQALVEEYIAGREISVGILGVGADLLVLPPLEVVFGAHHPVPVRTFATKHLSRSPQYWGFSVECPAALAPAEREVVERVARKAYRAIGCDGYARVDLRLADDGTPYVLEVNANCSLEVGITDLECGLLPLMARAAGWTYADLLQIIIGVGRLRAPPRRRVPFGFRWAGGVVRTHALHDLAAGERVARVGPVFPLRRGVDLAGLRFMTSGRRALRAPRLERIDHHPDPNLRVSAEAAGPWLVARRSIAAGEPLTRDRDEPLPIATPRRPRGIGRRTEDHARQG